MEPVTSKLRRTRLFANLPENGLAELLSERLATSERTLRRDSRLDRLAGTSEDDEARIPLGINFLAAVGRKGGT